MKLDGPALYAMMLSASNALNNNREAINNMNVFPVPDGDTGINMSLTLDAVKQIDDPSVKVSDLSKKIASVILRAARGNSGAILSLFFRGMSKAFVDVEEVDSADVARAFRKGTDEAYRAVMNPTEGTILTVMRKCTEAAEQAAAEGRFKGDVRGMFEYIVDIGADALAHTPDQLPILKEVNVVDAGGYGFMTALNGMLAALNKKPVELINTTPATESGEADFANFDTDSITFPYCTECIVEKSEEFAGEDKAEELHKFVGGMGDSVVFAEDDTIIKIHVHTDHPGLVLDKACEYGMLVTVKVENMRKQHSALVASEQEVKEAKEAERAPVIAEPVNEHGFVSVCMGEGVRSTFLDLGVDNTIFGGQTMNPSTQDIIDGVMATPAKNVFVLPNNKNIYLVAVQAAKLVKDRNVIVMETRSVPQGISAMIAYNADASVEENVAMMNDAIAAVKSISVTHAVRDTVIEGERIENGQMLGMLDGKIAHVADTSEECIENIVSGMTNASFVTVFYGEDISEDQANGVVDIISAKLPDAEIVVVNGGQPIYTYIISVE
ncbi:MAG: DAK2 domain-containing protein [Clostridia bacterium]|nr:DAK2 domain-containing protein [Clostridia bacterium]